MSLEILSIVLSSVLSLIAVIVSIVSIRRQTHSQNVTAAIQLFDKRFEIYNFVIDAWFIIGYFEGGLDLKNGENHYYNQIVEFCGQVELSQDIRNRIKVAYENVDRFKRMQSLLFSGDVSDYLKKFLSAFSIYISGIHHKRTLEKNLAEETYRCILEMYDTEEIDMKQLKEFIDLSDVKRIDVKRYKSRG